MKRIGSTGSIRTTVEEVLNSLGQGGRLTEFLILHQWEKLVGTQIASRSNPLYLRGGVLTVAVYNSVWMHQISFYGDEMAVKVNKLLGEKAVDRVKFSLTMKPDWKTAGESVEDRPLAREPSAEDRARIEEACVAIKDPELRKVVRRFLFRQASL
jgi:hypothetical protein